VNSQLCDHSSILAAQNYLSMNHFSKVNFRDGISVSKSSHAMKQLSAAVDKKVTSCLLSMKQASEHDVNVNIYTMLRNII
jgi:hypothetical protein